MKYDDGKIAFDFDYEGCTEDEGSYILTYYFKLCLSVQVRFVRYTEMRIGRIEVWYEGERHVFERCESGGTVKPSIPNEFWDCTRGDWDKGMEVLRRYFNIQELPLYTV